MAYKTYITDALVCGSFNGQGADRTFLLFTHDAGMIFASARSVRKEASKHRYALQDSSYARVTLVRGKSGWKVTGAEPLSNFYSRTNTREARGFVKNIIILLRRVMRGETAHPQVFDDVISACLHSEEHSVERLEQFLTLRILHELGYIAPSDSYARFLGGTFPYEALETVDLHEAEACKSAIDRALLESHL